MTKGASLDQRLDLQLGRDHETQHPTRANGHTASSTTTPTLPFAAASVRLALEGAEAQTARGSGPPGEMLVGRLSGRVGGGTVAQMAIERLPTPWAEESLEGRGRAGEASWATPRVLLPIQYRRRSSVCDFPEELSLRLVSTHAASRTPAVQ